MKTNKKLAVIMSGIIAVTAVFGVVFGTGMKSGEVENTTPVELAVETDRTVKEYADIVTLDNEKVERDDDIISALINLKNQDRAPVVNTGNVEPEKPFDQTNPEIFESGRVAFADNTILIKTKASFGGQLTKEYQDAGVGKLEVLFEMDDYTWYEAYIYDDVDITDVMDAVRNCSTTVVAEYNYVYEASADINGGNSLPNTRKQWNLHQYDLRSAWKYMEDNGVPAGGKPSVVVAVIDTGVDYTHSALHANMWKNTAEIPDNGIDDDGNGFVDDYYGADFVNGHGSGDDDHGHGTHVAGIIGAYPSKNNDVVGVAYNTKIMAIKAGDASGHFLNNNIVKAIKYAYENGADVINMSFGGSANNIAVRDALAMAYSRCVLVASAGNDGRPNENSVIALPNYPAALPYVIGVMSIGTSNIESKFTNYDGILDTGIEYEVYAPGENILSTLPGERYATLSGTSMAAPMVAGQAALLRSMYSDRDTYPSKFIYGQIIGTADDSVNCVAHLLHDVPGKVNVLNSLKKMPRPDVRISDWTIFDTAGFKADKDRLTNGCENTNNGDGIIDAGETVAVGFTLKNRWGMSKDTVVSVTAENELGMTNPYVTILNNDINYGGVGTYSEKDCGKLYDSTGDLWTGWEKPFYIRIAKNCPNDATIVLKFTVTSQNALDGTDLRIYSYTEEVSFSVRNGVVLTGAITKDTVLTKDNYYIIPNSVTVMEGATLTIEPGTQIQFWTNDAEDAYAETGIAYIEVRGKLNAMGTAEEHISMFPSELMGDYVVSIYEKNTGRVELKYTDIANGTITASVAQNCTFTTNYEDSYIVYRNLDNYSNIWHQSGGQEFKIEKADSCSFYRIRNKQISSIFNYKGGMYTNCAFIDCNIDFSEGYAGNEGVTYQNCLFYGNSKSNDVNYVPDTYEAINYTSHIRIINDNFEITSVRLIKQPETGKTYVLLNTNTFEAGNARGNLKILDGFAGTFDGKIPSFKNADEINAFASIVPLNGYGRDLYITGATYYRDGIYNYDGSLIEGFSLPINYNESLLLRYNGEWSLIYDYPSDAISTYVIEVPDIKDITDIKLDAYLINIGTNEQYIINPIITPASEITGDLIYESEDESIATVSADGVVTGVSQGTTNIRIYSSDLAIYNYLTVNVTEPVQLTGLSVDVEKLDVEVGKQSQVKPIFTPANTTQRAVTYESSDVAIATVDNRGVITAIAPGDAVITITGANGISTEITVHTYILPTEMSFKENVYGTSLTKDDGTAFYPKFSPRTATVTDLIWESSDPSVCYVDENGKLVKLTTGIATLKAINSITGLEKTVNIAISENGFDGKVVDVGNYQGRSSYYAVTDLGEVFIWGNDYNSPQRKFDGYKVAKLISENDALLQDGTIYSEPSSTLVPVDDVVYVNEYSPSDKWFRVDKNGAIYVQGKYTSSNQQGEFGDGSVISNPRTLSYTNINDKIVKIITSDYSTFFLSENGDVYFAGGSTARQKIPVKIYSDVKDIYSDGNTSAVVSIEFENQIIVAMGNDLPFVKYVINKDHDNMDTNLYYQYYIENGHVFIKGTGYSYDNNYGQLGIGTTDYNYHTEQYYEMKGITDAVKVQPIDYNHVFIITENGELYVTGSGASKPTATSSTANLLVPTKVSLFEMPENTDVKLVNSNIKANKLDSSDIVLSMNTTFENSTNYAQIVIKDSDNKVIPTFKSIDFNKLVITPSKTLSPNTSYTLVIPQDAIKNPFDAVNKEITIPFTTTSLKDININFTDYNGEKILSDDKIVLSYPFSEINLVDTTGIRLRLDYRDLKIDVTKEDGAIVIRPLEEEFIMGKNEYLLTIPAGKITSAHGESNELIDQKFTFWVFDDTKDLEFNVSWLYKREGMVDLLWAYSSVTINTSYPITSSLNNAFITDSNGSVFDKNNYYIDSYTNFNTYVVYLHNDFNDGEIYTLTIPRGTITTTAGTNEEICVEFQVSHAKPENIIPDETDYDVKHEIVVDEELLANRHELNSEDIMQKWNEFTRGGKNLRFYSNAIINRLNNDDVTTWLRIQAPTSSEYTTIDLGQNYWGTTNKTLIDKQIVDFDDFGTLADINTGEILTTAPETVWPFVVDAYLTVEDARVSTVGNEEVTFVVEFNRDMDTSIELNVGFGSKYPYNDYNVSGEYVTPRQWKGTVTLTTLIENGYQYFSVSNGKAADADMKLFNDWGRFPFTIDTSSAQALIMQANAMVDGIQLTWVQDDFDTLAGYNVYRSTAEDGKYTRINRTIISADTKEWLDDTVEPGMTYYYNFTVVKTDLTESEPSGKVTCRSYDNMAPNLYHSPVYFAFTGSNLVLSATITDNIAVAGAKVYFRVMGTEDWNTTEMFASNDKYTAIVDESYITTAGLEYYIEATDGNSFTYKGSAEEPYQVTVQTSIDERSLGDVDGNGTVELKDAMMLLMAINDILNLTDEQFARADINGNEILEAVEALRIMQYVNGSISSISF